MQSWNDDLRISLEVGMRRCQRGLALSYRTRQCSPAPDPLNDARHVSYSSVNQGIKTLS
jgi:hypothetical protein